MPEPSARARLALLIGIFALAVLLAPTAGASTATLVDAPSDSEASLKLGESKTFVYEVRNIHPTNLAFVQVSVSAPPGWEVVAEPTVLRLSPDSSGASANASAQVVVTARAAEPSYERGEAAVTFSITTAEQTTTITREISLVPASPFILGRFANPLPPPLDNAQGVFLINIGAFAIVGGITIFVQEPLLRAFARRSNKPLVDLAMRKLRTPVMILATFLGLDYSIRVLPPSPLVDISARIFGVGIYILALYLAYKIIDSALTYAGLKIARRTETRVDDILIPIARKIMIVIVVVGSFIMTLRTLEVDLTVFVAGGVVASMVLAFAAQETLSNFFSGIHILIDQPFREGDLIKLQNGEVCRVEHIGLRSTRLFHGRFNELIVLPNNQLSNNRVTNMVFPDRRLSMQIEVGVAYGTDPDTVLRILEEVAAANPRVVVDAETKPVAFFTAFGDSALNFIVHTTFKDVDDRVAGASEIRREIVRAFRERGIEIPFPQRDLWLRGVAEQAAVRLTPRAAREVGGDAVSTTPTERAGE